MANVVYSTPHLAEYFLGHRRTWDEFYPSERWVFERIGKEASGFGKVLDVGCAVGGLGNALAEKFSIKSYTGLDINAQAIDIAIHGGVLSVPTEYLCADIVTCSDVKDEYFDTVTALSVADWNVDTNAIIAACWKKVAPGGRLIVTQRLTNEDGIHDLGKSYQFIVPGDDFVMPEDMSTLEKAPYVVLNTHEALDLFRSQSVSPSEILAYGYWGKPSDTAVTPFSKLIFAVFSIVKPIKGREDVDTSLECHLPVAAFLPA